ncbi:hypothetical protein BHM03_00019566, partial [Ensete ventricosum]
SAASPRFNHPRCGDRRLGVAVSVSHCKFSAIHRHVSDRPPRLVKMTTSRRLADRKIEKFQKNITKRGSVPETTVKKGNGYPVGPAVLGFFIFVVIGSCKLS